MINNSGRETLEKKIIKGTVNVGTRKLAKAAFIVLRIPVNINKKTGKCKYLRFELPVSHEHKFEVRDFLIGKFDKGKFKAKVSIIYKQWKLEMVQELQACHGVDVDNLMRDALEAEIREELDEEVGSYMCCCNHILKDHTNGKQCFWSYNCDCKEFKHKPQLK